MFEISNEALKFFLASFYFGGVELVLAYSHELSEINVTLMELFGQDR